MVDLAFYRILGVSEIASAQEIKEAYLKLAFQYHPDRNQEDPAANERMKRINEAYETLSDSDKRQAYEALRERPGNGVPEFKKGDRVRVRLNSSPHMGHTGIVDKEPIKDSFRYWYMVRVETRGLVTVCRFAEEELERTNDR